MQSDITEGVKNLVNDGFVDSEQICIVGASYGGYAALAGATFTPDLYACVVSVNGISNLPRMLSEEQKISDFSLRYWERRLGNRFRDSTQLRAISPAKNAKNVRAPILLFYSKGDTVVPPKTKQRHGSCLEARKKTI